MQLRNPYAVKTHHTLHLETQVDSSTGPSTDYFDGIGAFLCGQCRPSIQRYFEDALFVPPIPGWYEVEANWKGDIDNGAFYAQLFRPDIRGGNPLRLWPVATGASGAIILGMLGYGTYLAPQGKLHGPLWRKLDQAKSHHYIALVDDCIFTGNTMDYMQAHCRDQGLEVVREAVLIGERNAA